MNQGQQLQLMRDKLKLSREEDKPVWVTLGNERMKIQAIDSKNFELANFSDEFIIHSNGKVHWPITLITKDAHPNFKAIGESISRYIKSKNIMAIILERWPRGESL